MGNSGIQRFRGNKPRIYFLIWEQEGKRNLARRNYSLCQRTVIAASLTICTWSNFKRWTRANWSTTASESQNSVLGRRWWHRPWIPRKHSQTGHWSLEQVVPSFIIWVVGRNWGWKWDFYHWHRLQISQRLSTSGSWFCHHCIPSCRNGWWMD